jgi:hypothetical protein
MGVDLLYVEPIEAGRLAENAARGKRQAAAVRNSPFRRKTAPTREERPFRLAVL